MWPVMCAALCAYDLNGKSDRVPHFGENQPLFNQGSILFGQRWSNA